MKILYPFLSCFLSVFSMAAQSVVSAIPASAAPANASAAYVERWAVFHNPAVLVGEKNISATLGYENRFMVKELSTASLGVAVPTKYVQVGGAFSFYGYEAYSEIQAGIAAARQFHPKFSMGVQFNYMSVYFSPSQGSRGTVIVQVGFLSEVAKNLYLGFSVYNPIQTNIKSESKLLNKRIPSVFSLGGMYRFSPRVLWVAQIDKEIGNNVHWATGFEYRFIDELSVRLGGFGSPFVPSLGFGAYFWKIHFDVNFERHPVLGINSVAKVGYTF